MRIYGYEEISSDLGFDVGPLLDIAQKGADTYTQVKQADAAKASALLQARLQAQAGQTITGPSYAGSIQPIPQGMALGTKIVLGSAAIGVLATVWFLIRRSRGGKVRRNPGRRSKRSTSKRRVSRRRARRSRR